VPLISDNQGSDVVALSAFIDYGRGWDRTPAKLSISDQQIAGTGLGLKISWMGGTADLIYAFPVIKPDNHQTEDLQDRGFHFLVTWSL
jgi:hemolysin activation/secretion protein